MHYNVTVFGTKDTTGYLVKYLIDHDAKPDLVVTIDEAVMKRNHIAGYADVGDVAKQYGIEVYRATDYSLGDEDTQAFFRENSFKIGISMGWQRIIPKSVLDCFEVGIFGYHGSCGQLPFGRGRSPLNWTIIKGDTRFINHFFCYSEVADWGSIYSTRTFEVTPHDSIRTLQYKAMLVGCQQALELVQKDGEGGLTNFQFDQSVKTWYKKRGPEDGRVSFGMRTRDIHNLVRGVTDPFPGAFMEMDGHRVQVWQVQPFDQVIDFSSYRNGEIIEIFDGNLIIKTVDGSLLITSYESDMELKAGMRFE